MSLPIELASLFGRDLKRLLQEVQAFPDQGALWAKPDGIANSAGNLTLHLEGNLRHYIGHQLGNTSYVRDRASEFSSTGYSIEELAARIEGLPDLIADVVSSLSSEALDGVYPELVLNASLSTRMFLLHLLGHLNYHLGQIDYVRRIVTRGTAVSFASL